MNCSLKLSTRNNKRGRGVRVLSKNINNIINYFINTIINT